MVMITVGTGIGGGIVLGGKLWRGANGMAGELGHIQSVPDGHPCGCGRLGCLEQYASGNALVRFARAGARQEPERAAQLLELAGGDPLAISGRQITEAARAGDGVARDAFAQIGYWLGVAMALIMAKAFKGRGIVRAGILVPWAIPTIVSALMWKLIFSESGVMNRIIGTQILWLADSPSSFWAVVIADVWKTAPFIGLLTLAGLQTIPAEVYEAAKVDGATTWQQFVRITLPMVRPTLVVAVLFRTLDTLRMFDLPWGMVGQGKYRVETVSIFAYQEATATRYGPAAAYAIVLFVYVLLVAFLFVKVLGADVIGDSGLPKKKKRRGRGTGVGGEDALKAQGAPALEAMGGNH